MKRQRQLTMKNWKGAGRKAKVDKGIRHTKREEFFRPSSLHLTIKVRKTSAEIKSKAVLKVLHRAILRARSKGLRMIHYTLEYDHVHLLVEASSNQQLHSGMQAFGICFAKGINKVKGRKGNVYKHRYHLHLLRSAREVKNVLHYILKNGIKHGRTYCAVDPFNSMLKENLIPADIKIIRDKILSKSLFMRNLGRELDVLLDPGRIFFKQIPYLSGKTV